MSWDQRTLTKSGFPEIMMCSAPVSCRRPRPAASARAAILAAVALILAAATPAMAQDTQGTADPAPPSTAEPAAPAASPTPATEPQPAPAATEPAADAAPAAAPASEATGGTAPAVPVEDAPPQMSAPAPGGSTEAEPAPGLAPVGQTTGVAHLPHDLSPWGMFMSADIVVKAVMIGLAFASVVTWTIWLAKSLELAWAKRRLVRAFARVQAASSLAEAAQRLDGKPGIVTGLIELAAVELRLSADVSDKAGIKERVTSRLDGLAAAAGRDMNRGTGVLATIGSTAPFVGLFGTVWGIMNSFIGISEAQTTNLAVVAPGIAEALLATALGLVAAIPAVIIYNQFARAIAGYKAVIAEASAEVLRLVSRDLDRGFKIVPGRAAE